jgi:hypothetical protein
MVRYFLGFFVGVLATIAVATDPLAVDVLDRASEVGKLATYASSARHRTDGV